ATASRKTKPSTLTSRTHSTSASPSQTVKTSPTEAARSLALTAATRLSTQTANGTSSSSGSCHQRPEKSANSGCDSATCCRQSCSSRGSTWLNGPWLHSGKKSTNAAAAAAAAATTQLS